ncbi:MAG: hypothetical protein ACK53L_34845, partial [Pirellulaceae bacterium]
FFNSENGGINRIKVTFNPTLNPITGNQCHEDNVVIILIDRNQVSQYPIGQLLSFQDSNLSKDINVLNSVTGQTLTGIQTISVNYADSVNGGNSNRTYQVNFSGDSTSQVKFPMDIEYYQVIHTSTLLQLKTDSTQDGNSFFGRVFLQSVYM